MNNMLTCMAFEAEMMPRANKYYESQGFYNIRRARWESDGGCEKQRHDIDLEMRDSHNRIIAISEKFRTRDYDDVIIELSSNWDTNATYNPPGSTMKSWADYIYYWSPMRLVIIEISSLKEALKKLDLADIKGNTFTKPQKARLVNGEAVTINGLTFRSFGSYMRARRWKNICLLASIDQLKELGVNITIYNTTIYPKEYYAIDR